MTDRTTAAALAGTTWLFALLAGSTLAAPSSSPPTTAPATQSIRLWDGFPRLAAPGTGRAAVQLTAGPAACYPLYYFIPSLSRDGRYLVHHRYEQGEVQLWRLDLQTGQEAQLAHASGGDHADWRPWQREPGLRGVLDYRGVLNVARDLVIYFDGRQARAVNLLTLRDEGLLFELPEGREAIGQNCATPDGRRLIYIDAPQGAENPKPCKGAELRAYDFDTRQQQRLCVVDNAIHHVMPWDDEHFIVNHPPGHNGIIWTDATSGTWTELRRGDPGVKGASCHQLPTAAGIAYEAFGDGATVVAGLYDPFTRRRLEFRLPPAFGYTHTGFDPQGRLWFFEQQGKAAGHSLWYMPKLDPSTGAVLRPLTGDWKIATPGQRGHFHPQLTPDRRWILMTGGDEKQVAQIFLLDASDLKDTQGVCRDLLDARGANDVRVPGVIGGE
jgi:hypothetical protein